MQNKYNYIFGPVPSRRLGWSLGVDIIPLKTCSQNCRYCQLGMNGKLTSQRKEYVNINNVLEDLERKLAEKVKIDYITISGSGEPTLNSGIGRLIAGIKRLTSIPIVVITNGTLLWDADVRRDLTLADVVMPSLDAPDQQTFELINKPDAGITFDMLLDGLMKFRKEFDGEYWLEVFLLDGLNTSAKQIEGFKQLISEIKPDRIQLNTAVRPVTDQSAKMVTEEEMKHIADILGDRTEVIASFSGKKEIISDNVSDTIILQTLKRRPCTIEGLSVSLGVNANAVVKIIDALLKEGLIISEQKPAGTFYKPA